MEALDPKTRRQVAQEVAKALVKKAKKGDVKAFQAVADRLEGKPPQSVKVDGRMSGTLVLITNVPEPKRDRG